MISNLRKNEEMIFRNIDRQFNQGDTIGGFGFDTTN